MEIALRFLSGNVQNLIKIAQGELPSGTTSWKTALVTVTDDHSEQRGHPFLQVRIGDRVWHVWTHDPNVSDPTLYLSWFIGVTEGGVVTARPEFSGLFVHALDKSPGDLATFCRDAGLPQERVILELGELADVTHVYEQASFSFRDGPRYDQKDPIARFRPPASAKHL
ncbi:hypothetical protein EBS80_00075 [bacterium]|nr:hypothetical protein [bacterium]